MRMPAQTTQMHADTQPESSLLIKSVLLQLYNSGVS